MSVEIVKPIVAENGIEFYVSGDGSQSGVSQVGLARLCGVAETSIRRMVNTDRLKAPSKALESFTGNVFHLDLTSEQNAKIITTDAAAEIIFYYAFESTTTNSTAKFSAKQFAKQGMHNWIKEITHFASDDDTKSLTATMRELVTQVKDLVEENKTWRTVRRVADSHMQGVNILIEEIAAAEAEKLDQQFLPSSDQRTWSLQEWLQQEKGIVGLEKGKMIGLGRAVSETYKSLRQGKLIKDYRRVGDNMALVAVYTEEDFPILSVAFTKFMA